MKRTIIRLLPVLAGFLLSMGLLFAAGTFSACNQLYADTLRLHIRAASDDADDQARKLLVRDRLVTVTAEMTEGAEDADEAAAMLAENLSALQAEAEAVLRSSGSEDAVEVEICPQYFNTRRYETGAGTLTLPAGKYEALVVTIGEGQGHNWWCVLYPSLCLPAAEGQENVALSRYSGEEQQLVTGDYEVRFWLAEMWTRIVAWLDGEAVANR